MNFKEALIEHLQGAKVEAMGVEGVWKPFMEIVGDSRLTHFDAPSFCCNVSFRLASRTITVNGVEVPAPESVAPNKVVECFVPCPSRDALHASFDWGGSEFCREILKKGILYLEKESAIARAKAMMIVQSKTDKGD